MFSAHNLTPIFIIKNKIRRLIGMVSVVYNTFVKVILNYGKVKRYSAKLRQSSAKLVFESDKPTSETANNLGVKPSTLNGRVNKYCLSRESNKNQSSEPFPHEALKC
jgi:hypothetical protein